MDAKLSEAGNAPTSLPMPSCEKYWEEKDIEQKVATLGRAVEQIAAVLNHLEATVESLRFHSHSDGKIVTPLPSNPTYEIPWWRKNILGLAPRS